jgi:salicylate hydroxylase
VTYFPSEAIAKYGQPACGVKRTTLNLALKQALAGAGILVHEGWKLKDIVETAIGVEAISEDGRIEKASFLVGCDGIKAVSRTLILAKHGIHEEPASYTGLTQVYISIQGLSMPLKFCSI